MAKRLYLGANVFDAALQRIVELYEEGHRVVISISGGKDSTCVLELAVIAATMTGRLPVEVVTRDEEIIFPGVIEYLEETYQRDDVDMHWFVANQPIINCFNREQPYWWVFDPLVDEDEWVRKPPPYAEHIPEQHIAAMVTTERFPPDEGKLLVDCIGLRTQESTGRFLSVLSAGGHLTGERSGGARSGRPIYDWGDGAIWKAIHDNGWRYSTDYDVFHRMGVRRQNLRIGPPSMNVAAVSQLHYAAQAWPNWWDRVQRRLPGIRAAASYGKRVLEPERRRGESWETCFQRECIDEAPDWIAERSERVKEIYTYRHATHATTPFPEINPCISCSSRLGSWKSMAMVMYLGDPFAMKADVLGYVEPERFREGAGTWSGKPTW